MAILQRSVLASLLVTSVAVGIGGCDEPATATGLHPEGPPMIQQVFLKELYTDASMTLRVRTILGFGTHEAIEAEREHPTMTAAAREQKIRIVFDELLRGNHLEEIACRTRMIAETGLACVVQGDYSRVPDGTTPDDIADCSQPDDLVGEFCGGPHAVCLNSAGVACGVKDEDENGSADDTRMIAGQVRLVCGGVDVPLDLQESYWQPAGNQLVPAGLSAEASLGPALILSPANMGRLPTNSDCEIVFAADVTDKSDNRPCTPPGGDISVACASDGDMSGFSFKTEVMRMTSSSPENNLTGVGRDPGRITMFWNAALDPATITAAVTVVPALPNMAVTLTGDGNNLNITTCTQPTGTCVPGSFAASTTYTVTIATSLTDTFGKALTAPVTLTFTTGAL